MKTKKKSLSPRHSARLAEGKKKDHVYPSEADLTIIANGLEHFALCLNEQEQQRVLGRLNDDVLSALAREAGAYGSNPTPPAGASKKPRRQGERISDEAMLDWPRNVRADGIWLVVGDDNNGNVWELIEQCDSRWLRVVFDKAVTDGAVVVNYGGMTVEAQPGASDADLGKAIREAIKMSE
jgi:hypothetical protein